MQLPCFSTTMQHTNSRTSWPLFIFVLNPIVRPHWHRAKVKQKRFRSKNVWIYLVRMVQNRTFTSFSSYFTSFFTRCEWTLTPQYSAHPKKCINVTFIKMNAFFLWQETFGPNTGNMPRADHRGSQGSLTSAQGDVCRICHCESEPGMPLISPCVCAGSLKYVHQACLQQWIKSADTKSCELCKYNFQMTTRIKPFRKVRMLQ